eukprot:3138659-Prymnesium_polylepis.2
MPVRLEARTLVARLHVCAASVAQELPCGSGGVMDGIACRVKILHRACHLGYVDEQHTRDR